MKTIGLIGGMTWQSSATYYQIINRETRRRLGGAHSARILMHSIDFEEIVALQRDARWDEGGALLAREGERLSRAGAEVMLLCCNSMHCVSETVEKAAGMPLLHIADPLGEAIRQAGLTRVGLLGKLFTMRMPGVLTGRLASRHDIEVIVPEAGAAEEIHRTIYAFQNLGPDAFPESRRSFCRRVIAKLEAKGADGIILGCTELPLMLTAEDSDVPLFDTAALHAVAAVDAALG